MNIGIWVAIALVVLGGGTWYFVNSSSTTGENTTQEENGGGSSTFAELMMRAGSWTCEVTTTDEDAPSHGFAFIADGNVRADFTSTVNGQAMTSHMITADGYVHTWSDAYPQGMKMRIPEGQEAQEGSAPGTVPNDAQVEYECEPWAKDTSKFTPPSTVTFMELGAEGGIEIPMPY